MEKWQQCDNGGNADKGSDDRSQSGIDSGGSEGLNRMSGFPSLDLSESSF